MQSVFSFCSAHIAALLAAFSIASAIAALLDSIAKAIAPTRPKSAHVLAGIAHILPQVLQFAARMIAAKTGKPFEPAGVAK